MKAKVVGKPKLLKKDEETATIRTTVELRADAQAFRAFSVTLEQVLDKLGRDKGLFFLTARPIEFINYGRADGGFPVAPGSSMARHAESSGVRSDEDEDRAICFGDLSGRLYPIGELMPKVFIPNSANEMRRKGQFVVAINVKTNKLCDRTEWKFYCLDEVLKRLFLEAAMRQAQCVVSMLNSDGEEVLADAFQPDETSNFEITLMGAFTGCHFYPLKNVFTSPVSNLVIVSPLFFREPWLADTPFRYAYAPAATLRRDLQVRLADLKSLSSMKCELQFSEPAPK